MTDAAAGKPAWLSWAAMAGVFLLLMGCATTPRPGASLAWSEGAIGVRDAEWLSLPALRPAYTRFTPLRLRMSMLAQDGTQVAGDRSVGAAGLIGNTTNEVVPIPGTDMIRVGVLQEGTFSSNQFRSGAQEALSMGGRPGAVLIFTIARP